MFARCLAALCVGALFVPMIVSAFPFGGRITLYHVCYNETLFARLSPPTPGDYVWTTATKTYLFGPPRAVGQWLLGLTGIPFDCLWSINPIFPVPAIAIMMMGSSGPAAPMSPGGAFGAMPPVPTGNTGAGAGGGGAGYTPDPTNPGSDTSPGFIGAQTGRVLISEVFYDVDAAHGTDPTHEWVEIYNGTTQTLNFSGWSLSDASSTDTFAGGTQLAPGGFLIVAQTMDVKNFWSIPATVTVVTLGNPIGNGLGNAGDVVRLSNSSGAIVDSVSWGTNTGAFSPAAPDVQSGHSLSRSSLLSDSDTASDWRDVAVPTPGR